MSGKNGGENVMADKNIGKELKLIGKKLDDELSNILKQRKKTIIIGIASIAIMLIYFSIISILVTDVLDPSSLAYAISEQVVKYIPDLRKDLEKTAKKETPAFVNVLMDQIVYESIPKIRVKFEKKILNKAEKSMIEIEELLFEQIEILLIKNRDRIEVLSANLSSDEGKDAFEKNLYEMLEDILETPEIKEELESYKIAIKQLDGILLYFSQDDFPLSEEDKTIRELIAILREFLNRESYT